jgi:hypothetical protein
MSVGWYDGIRKTIGMPPAGRLSDDGVAGRSFDVMDNILTEVGVA